MTSTTTSPFATPKSRAARKAHRKCQNVVTHDCPSLTSLLITPKLLKELGPVDINWFDRQLEATSPLVVRTSSPKQQSSELDTVGRDSHAELFSLPITPLRGRQHPENLFDTDSTPVKYNEGGRWGIPRKKFECPMAASMEFGFIPCTQEVSRYPLSTPDQILSLGASMGGHDLSWTSSMATPSKSLSSKSKINSSSGIDDGSLLDSALVRLTKTPFTDGPHSPDLFEGLDTSFRADASLSCRASSKRDRIMEKNLVRAPRRKGSLVDDRSVDRVSPGKPSMRMTPCRSFRVRVRSPMVVPPPAPHHPKAVCAAVKLVNEIATGSCLADGQTPQSDSECSLHGTPRLPSRKDERLSRRVLSAAMNLASSQDKQDKDVERKQCSQNGVPTRQLATQILWPEEALHPSYDSTTTQRESSELWHCSQDSESGTDLLIRLEHQSGNNVTKFKRHSRFSDQVTTEIAADGIQPTCASLVAPQLEIVKPVASPGDNRDTISHHQSLNDRALECGGPSYRRRTSELSCTTADSDSVTTVICVTTVDKNVDVALSPNQHGFDGEPKLTAGAREESSSKFPRLSYSEKFDTSEVLRLAEDSVASVNDQPFQENSCVDLFDGTCRETIVTDTNIKRNCAPPDYSCLVNSRSDAIRGRESFEPVMELMPMVDLSHEWIKVKDSGRPGQASEQSVHRSLSSPKQVTSLFSGADHSPLSLKLEQFAINSAKVMQSKVSNLTDAPTKEKCDCGTPERHLVTNGEPSIGVLSSVPNNQISSVISGLRNEIALEWKAPLPTVKEVEMDACLSDPVWKRSPNYVHDQSAHTDSDDELECIPCSQNLPTSHFSILCSTKSSHQVPNLPTSKFNVSPVATVVSGAVVPPKEKPIDSAGANLRRTVVDVVVGREALEVVPPVTTEHYTSNTNNCVSPSNDEATALVKNPLTPLPCIQPVPPNTMDGPLTQLVDTVNEDGGSHHSCDTFHVSNNVKIDNCEEHLETAVNQLNASKAEVNVSVPSEMEVGEDSFKRDWMDEEVRCGFHDTPLDVVCCLKDDHNSYVQSLSSSKLQQPMMDHTEFSNKPVVISEMNSDVQEYIVPTGMSHCVVAVVCKEDAVIPPVCLHQSLAELPRTSNCVSSNTLLPGNLDYEHQVESRRVEDRQKQEDENSIPMIGMAAPPLNNFKEMGFMTGKGLSICISSEARKRGASLLAEVDELDLATKRQKLGQPVGLVLASCVTSASKNKPVSGFARSQLLPFKRPGPVQRDEQVCLKSWNNVKGETNAEISTVSDEDVIGRSDQAECATKNCLSMPEQTFVGFNTAGNKLVNISGAQLQGKSNLESEKNCLTVGGQSFAGFSTASGKLSCVSGDHLERARAIFAKEDDNKVDRVAGRSATGSTVSKEVAPKDTDWVTSNLQKMNKSVGHDYLCHEPVAIASTSFKGPHESITVDNRAVNLQSSFSCGFLAASGKKVAISERALQIARMVFEGLDDDLAVPSPGLGPVTGKAKCDSESFEANKKRQVPFVCRFAKDQNAAVSMKNQEVAICSEKTVFTKPTDKLSIAKEIIPLFKSEAKPLGGDIVCGFTKASGKKVSVSEKALEQARNSLASHCDVWQTDASGLGDVPQGTEHRTSVVKNGMNLSSHIPPAGESKSEQFPPLPDKIPQTGTRKLPPVTDKLFSIPERVSSIVEDGQPSPKKALPPEDFDFALLDDDEWDDLPLECTTTTRSESKFQHTDVAKPTTPKRTHPALSAINKENSLVWSSRAATTLEDSHKSPQHCLTINRPQPLSTNQMNSTAIDNEVHESILAYLEDEETSNIAPWFSTSEDPWGASNQPSLVHRPKDAASPRGSVGLKRQHHSIMAEEVSPNSKRICAVEQVSRLGVVSTSLTNHVADQRNMSLPLSATVLECRQSAIKEQLSRIAAKRRQKIVRVDGMLFASRKVTGVRRVSLRSFLDGRTPQRLSDQEAASFGVRHSTLLVNSGNAGEYKFRLEEHLSEVDEVDTGIMMLDSTKAKLIFDEQNWAGKEEFFRLLMDTDGVDPGLVSPEWVHNHYRWIVWKLAATEVSFPAEFGGRLLTPDVVASQLHFRYNVEIDNSRRPALRKILEQDDVPNKTMVLCVARVINLGGSHAPSTSACETSLVPEPCILELTDGWYGLQTLLDEPLANLVASRRIRPGTKLVIHGAELTGSADACPPLEAPAHLYLKINANCCRPARWDAKLGFQAATEPFPLPLSTLSFKGGLVGRVDVVVVRVYPVQYMERMAEGHNRVLNQRAHDEAENEFHRRRSDFLEKIASQIERDVDGEVADTARGGAGRRKYTRSVIRSLATGEEIAQAVADIGDAAFVEESLTDEQRRLLESHRQVAVDEKQVRLNAMLQKALEDTNDSTHQIKRDVTPFLKVRAMGLSPRDILSSSSCLITLWRPSEDVQCTLVEGRALTIYNLIAETRGGGFSTRRDLQLKTGRLTTFRSLDRPHDPLPFLSFTRCVTPLAELTAPDFRPPFAEVDVTAVVVRVVAELDRHSRGFASVYLADAERHLAVIKFWDGLKAFGVHHLIQPATVLTVLGLQWREFGRLSGGVPALYANELTVFSANPRSSAAAMAAEKIGRRVGDLAAFVAEVSPRVDEVVAVSDRLVSGRSSSTTPGRGSPLFLGRPVSTSTPSFERRGGGGRDCSFGGGASTSTMASPSPHFSPAIRNRMERLSCYGQAPPLPPLASLVSPRSSSFRDPRKKLDDG